MRRRIVAACGAAWLCLIVASTNSVASGGTKAQIARGEYLVKAIGQCGDCHTPFNDHGQYIMAQWLQGKKLEFGPLVPMPVWADTSPNIAGLAGMGPGKGCAVLHDRPGSQWTTGAASYAGVQDESRRRRSGGRVSPVVEVGVRSQGLGVRG